MLSKTLKLTLAAVLLLNAGIALAIPFGAYDARTMAMGGVGVAIGEGGTAPLYNPALLSVAKDGERFSMILPSIYVNLNDASNLVNSIDKFQAGNYVNNLQTSVTDLQAAINTVNSATPATVSAAIADVGVKAGAVSTNLNSVSSQLSALSNKPITAEFGAATVIAAPDKKRGFAFYANGSVTAGGIFLYKDSALVTAIANQTQCLANAAALPTTTPGETATALAAVQACTPPNFSSSQLASGIDFRGVALGETGFSFSREVYINNRSVAFGITPKFVRAQLFDASFNVNNSVSGFNIADYRADYTLLNFDLGVAKYFRRGWRGGLVVKNFLTQTLDFKNAPTPGAQPVPNGNQLTLRPQVRAGVSHSDAWSTMALDIDLNRNDPAGLENYTQYVAVGGEINAMNWAQLRVGYRMDLVSSTRNIMSVGLGFSPYGMHADIAVAGNYSEIAGSFQLGYRF